MAKTLPIIERDSWLEPVADEMIARNERYLSALQDINQQAGSIINFANGYNYFGFHYDSQAGGWRYREWLPGASAVFVFGDFNGWQRRQLPLINDGNGIWSIFLSDLSFKGAISHGSRVKILVEGDNGVHERIPACIRRVVQDPDTKDFVGQIWCPEPYKWKHSYDPSSIESPLIYECHIGMACHASRISDTTPFRLWA